MLTDLEKFYNEQDRQEQLEHRDVLLAIGSILQSKEGREIFGYLFKNFDVAEAPEIGLTGEVLHDRLGFIRAGNSIYKLVCEADFDIAASILSKIERDRYVKKYNEHRLKNTSISSTDD
jgi:hypothetical protein